MLRPFFQRRFAEHRKQERGVTMALVALAIVGIVGLAALSIDVGTLYQASAEAQRSADEAALAAAKVLSLSGMTGDPGNVTGNWNNACIAATQAAQTIASQNNIGGSPPTAPVPTYFSSDGTSNCTNPGSFGVNPMVTVKVSQPNLSTFFAHVFGLFNNNWKTATVTATATAEAFNPSGSATYTGGVLIPVQPRCVKPLVIPNLDPLNPHNPPFCTGTCLPFVSLTDGSIQNPGIMANNNGVIGETFHLVPDCKATGSCSPIPSSPPVANFGGVPPYTLQYLPGQVISPSAAPSCATPGYQQAIAGCEQASAYQCGVQFGAQLDLTENPVLTPSDTAVGTECLIHQLAGQDTISTGAYPFQITAGPGNPLNVSGSVITSSDSVVAIPIYDQTVVLPGGNNPSITIVGFLQVFINQFDPLPSGSVNVTVLNVVGCGNGLTTRVASTSLNGSSPVPVRLITPPPTTTP